MAQFDFQLDGVLRHREHVEEQRQRELAAVLKELADLEARLRELDTQFRSSAQDLRTNKLVGQLDLAWLAGHRRYSVGMRKKVMAMAEQMAAVRVRADAARKSLAEAAMQRKILEKLRESRKAQWAKDQARQETDALDEIAAQIGYRVSLSPEDE